MTNPVAAAASIGRGRPRKPGTDTRKYFDGELYPLLAAKLPNHITRGRLDVKSLAAAVRYSTMALYRAMEQDKVSPELGRRIVAEAKGRLKPEDLAKFLFA